MGGRSLDLRYEIYHTGTHYSAYIVSLVALSPLPMVDIQYGWERGQYHIWYQGDCKVEYMLSLYVVSS